ncbi:MAG: ATP-binding protein [Actinobacteria bacterium]|nr:ATP-binding protein [Actinomycetota bacterium]
MTRFSRTAAWTLVGLVFTLLAIGNVLTDTLGFDRSVESVALLVAYLAIAVIGALVASRHPRNPVGWLLLGVALFAALSYASVEFVAYLVVERGMRFAAAGTLAAFGPLGWGMSGGLILLVLHLFPDGRPLSPRWAWPFWLGVFGLACAALAVVLSQTVRVGSLHAPVVLDNPVAQWVGPTVHGFFETAALSIAPVVVLTPVVVILRYRRSRGRARQQMKVLAYAIAVAAGLPALGAALTKLGVDAGGLLFVIGITLLPASIGTAILRHGLYDIDVVISKTVVFAGLAAFITGIYVAIVVGVGTLIGAGDEPNLALSIVATALVAVAFQPVRERLTKVANRLVFGKRATPYEVLSRFSSHLGETVATEQTLERMARLLADGAGAARAQVWLKAAGQMRTAASWPADAAPDFTPVVADDGSLPAFAEVDVAVPIVHHDEVLGALTITKKRGEGVTPTEQKLIDDLAAQAGLVVRNVQLTADLLARLEELGESRRRLVAAQDEERRRLERDLHDGAQQQLVALKIKLGIAKTLAEREQATKTAKVVDGLSADADDAVQTLRELAHGIYPPLLAAEGLPAALTTQARKAAIPVQVVADGIGRYPQEIEAAVYFCVLEALNNVAKYAHASKATVTLAQRNGDLTFTVVDDGVGFDPATTPRGHGLTNMTDRLHALAGAIAITSESGHGTTVTGTVTTPVASKVGIA